MTTPTVSHRSSRGLALTPKGRLAVQLSRLECVVDQLTEAEQASLAAELAPIVRCARTRVAFRTDPAA